MHKPDIAPPLKLYDTPTRRHSRRVFSFWQRGTTLVELITVMTVLGIISAIGVGRFADMSAFSGQAAADQLASSLRSAHRMAVAQRQTLYVRVIASPLTLDVCSDAACASPIAPPDGSSTWLNLKSDVQLVSGSTYAVDAFGRPSFSAAVTLSPVDAGNVPIGPTVRIEPESGLVRVM